MDFTIDDEQEALREAVRDLATSLAASGDGRAAEVGPADFDEVAWKALAEMGVVGLTIDEDHEGMGATAVELMLAAQELGRARVRTPLAESVLAATLLDELDGPADLLARISAGEALVIPALDEPSRAWSLDATDVTASDEADGWVLTGTKAPIRYAANATALLVTARVGDVTGIFLVENPEVTGDEVRFDRTPAVLLGGLDAASDALQRAVNLATVALLAEALGAMEDALRLTTDYLKTRKQFGVPLMTFQALTHRAADMYVSLELARSVVQYAAMVATEEQRGEGEAVSAVRRARVVVGRASRHIGQEAIQLHGGIGMTAEYSVGHHTSRLTAIAHTLGTTRQHLAALAATIGDHEGVDVLG